MKILVVDDEKRARESVVQVLKMYCPEVTEIFQADGITNAREMLRTQLPDAVLLDIQLKDGNGFELSSQISDMNIPVIFITAHEEYALKAFKVAALNYLLKPIDPDELIQSIQRVALNQQKSGIEAKLAVFLEYSMRKTESPKRIVLRTSDSMHVVETKDIIYCEADRNYTTFHLLNRHDIVVSRNIGEYEELLNDSEFIRIHQSILFNISFIERYEKGDGGFVMTHTGQRLPVSSRKKDLLLAALNRLK